MFGIVACNKKEVDYVESDIKQQSDNVNQDISTDKIKNKLGVSDSWSEKIDDEYGISIGADVKVPDVSYLKVIKASKFIFTNEEKKLFIHAITDEPVYDYPVFYKDMTKLQLKEYISYNEDCLKMSEDILQDVEREDIEEQLSELYSYYETAPDEFSLSLDYSSTAYYTRYNDIEFTIYFMGGDETSSVVMRPIHYKKIYDEESYEIVDFQMQDKNYEADNLCDISENEAKKTAYEFVDKLNYGEFVIVDNYPLSCVVNIENNNDHNSKKYYDGYTFVMYREIDGVAVDGRDWDSVVLHPSTDVIQEQGSNGGYVRYPGYGFEKMYVCVNDDGVIYFNYEAPFRLGKVSSSDVILLSYEKIQEIIREEILKQGIYSYKCFNSMELKYLPIKDINNPSNYSVIPVWMLTVETKYVTTSYIVVNAIDGTVINMEELYYEIDKQE